MIKFGYAAHDQLWEPLLSRGLCGTVRLVAVCFGSILSLDFRLLLAEHLFSLLFSLPLILKLLFKLLLALQEFALSVCLTLLLPLQIELLFLL